MVEERLWCRVEGGQHCRTWMRLYMEGPSEARCSAVRLWHLRSRAGLREGLGLVHPKTRLVDYRDQGPRLSHSCILGARVQTGFLTVWNGEILQIFRRVCSLEYMASRALEVAYPDSTRLLC